MALGSSAWSRKQATATAGAVLRPTGSRTMEREPRPDSRSCSAIRNLWSSLHTTTGRSNRPLPDVRRSVRTNRLSEASSLRRCLGRAARDKGQRRVPAPPERITGITFRAVTEGAPCRGQAVGGRVRRGIRPILRQNYRQTYPARGLPRHAAGPYSRRMCSTPLRAEIGVGCRLLQLQYACRGRPFPPPAPARTSYRGSP